MLIKISTWQAERNIQDNNDIHLTNTLTITKLGKTDQSISSNVSVHKTYQNTLYTCIKRNDLRVSYRRRRVKHTHTQLQSNTSDLVRITKSVQL